MKRVPLATLIYQCQRWLTPDLFTDYDRAHNGLQVSNRGEVGKIVAAVDASLATVTRAAARGADLMIVHHGLFWNQAVPWTGKRYDLIRTLIESDVAVYSMHLPLDAHRTLGNAARLGRALGFKAMKPFFHQKGRALGWRADLRISRAELGSRLGDVLGGAPVVLEGGSEQCRKIGICTGGAGAELKLAAAEGVDTFITGEGPHWTHSLAEDAGINVFYGGHYATETFGVKALAEKLSGLFQIPWEFVDHPSGL